MLGGGAVHENPMVDMIYTLEDSIMSGDIKVQIYDGHPEFKVKPEAMQALIEPWRFSVVVKLIGKNVNYTILNDCIASMWKLKFRYKIIDLTYGYYIVQLGCEDDYIMAMSGDHGQFLVHIFQSNPGHRSFE